MASNFARIGFIGDDLVALEQQIVGLCERSAEDAPPTGGVQHTRWSDASGASLVYHRRGKEIQCLNPYFAHPENPARWRVKASPPKIDGDCADCGYVHVSALDADGMETTQSFVQLLHPRPFVHGYGSDAPFDMEVVAFANRIRWYADADAFAASEDGSFGSGEANEPTMKWSPNFFLPFGMFGEEDGATNRAVARFAGVVERCDRRTNAASGGTFGYARVQSLPGPVDVVFAEEDGPGALVGGLAVVDAWLVGRPCLPFPPVPANPWWKQLFGR